MCQCCVTSTCGGFSWGFFVLQHECLKESPFLTYSSPPRCTHLQRVIMHTLRSISTWSNPYILTHVVMLIQSHYIINLAWTHPVISDVATWHTFPGNPAKYFLHYTLYHIYTMFRSICTFRIWNIIRLCWKVSVPFRLTLWACWKTRKSYCEGQMEG